MDASTARFYEDNAQDIATRYESVGSPVAKYFPLAFVPGARLLDIGAGSGRDLAHLLKSGYEAYGVEPTDGLRAAAKVAHPELENRLASAALPELGMPFDGKFDGILCSAVLMHVPDHQLFDAALAIRALLNPHGRLLLSLPLTRGDNLVEQRDTSGRLFQGYTAEEIQLLFERLGFQCIGRWDSDDALARAGTSWYTLLLELRTTGTLRAIDQIEGVLNRDKKVATYKLALFRALADIAMHESKTAVWQASGQVGVPLLCIAEKWLMYYWPIFASQQFTPQSQSEGAGGIKPVKFRAALTALMQPYRDQGAHGGLSAWHLDWLAGRLSGGMQDQLRSVLRLIAQTIRLGPVEFSGGALESGTVFEYDSPSGLVLMPADIWKELSLLGHWIADAVVLRWAALTERFGYRQGITSGAVLPLLLARPDPERATMLARRGPTKEPASPGAPGPAGRSTSASRSTTLFRSPCGPTMTCGTFCRSTNRSTPTSPTSCPRGLLVFSAISDGTQS
ncbi:class I SAM-dependent methyltransferase [Pseudomonas aeruginosa]